MSGGHWNYRQYELQEQAGNVRDMMLLMAELQDCLDWGICADTCYECAKIIVAELVEHFFDYGEVAKWRKSKALCPKCGEKL